MGLDIYSGKLTRYYSRNWKTIVQQMSEGNGQKWGQAESTVHEF